MRTRGACKSQTATFRINLALFNAHRIRAALTILAAELPASAATAATLAPNEIDTGGAAGVVHCACITKHLALALMANGAACPTMRSALLRWLNALAKLRRTAA